MEKTNEKKIIFIPVLLIMFLFIFSVQPAIAELVFAMVSIDRVGQTATGGAGRFTEVNGIFTFTPFVFESTNSKALLATTLTAFSLGKNVIIRFEDTTNNIVQVFVDK
jgi:hypothetical protein